MQKNRKTEYADCFKQSTPGSVVPLVMFLSLSFRWGHYRILVALVQQRRPFPGCYGEIDCELVDCSTKFGHFWFLFGAFPFGDGD